MSRISKFKKYCWSNKRIYKLCNEIWNLFLINSLPKPKKSLPSKKQEDSRNKRSPIKPNLSLSLTLKSNNLRSRCQRQIRDWRQRLKTTKNFNQTLKSKNKSTKVSVRDSLPLDTKLSLSNKRLKRGKSALKMIETNFESNWHRLNSKINSFWGKTQRFREVLHKLLMLLTIETSREMLN